MRPGAETFTLAATRTVGNLRLTRPWTAAAIFRSVSTLKLVYSAASRRAMALWVVPTRAAS